MGPIRLWLVMGAVLLSASLSWGNPKCKYNYRLMSMGSVFEIQLVGPCTSKSNQSQIVLLIQKRLDKIENEMSLYQTSSLISQFNQSGRIQNIPRDFLNVLKISVEGARLTSGAFDPTIWPILEIIQKSFAANKKPPAQSELDKFKSVVSYELLKMNHGKLISQKPGVKITLDGLAKGYAVDEVARALQNEGWQNYLINFSGNMKWQGLRIDGQPWRIQIWDPLANKAVDFDSTPHMKTSGAISSSGVDHNHYSKDKKWHHIIDPRTLRPASRWVAATVSGPLAVICDLLSTATFVMSEDEIKSVLKEHYSQYRVRAIAPVVR